MSKAIFIGGTASHVGKSFVTTAVCNWLWRQGVRVVPFKAQNMSNNSYPCQAGGEIGRAQVAQAEACGLEPEPDMNPILLKPTGNTTSQVVVNGKVWRTMPAREYYEHFPFLWEQVLCAYQRLAARYEYIVIEGAGSVAELNLKHRDLVNLNLAREVGAPALLVADIDRGGVFASVIGTYCVLPDEAKDLLRSFVVNRFRGDPALFGEGVKILQQRTQRPCLGVLPMIEDAGLDEEDSVALDGLKEAMLAGPRIAIIRLPRISNFTDFRLLRWATWVDAPLEGHFDVIILPGTKNTIGDLQWLRERKLDQWVLAQHTAGARVLGVCGGYQMLGESIVDPYRVESDRGEAAGLGLLPVRTVLRAEKTTRVVDAVTPAGTRFRAYEIHMGETERNHALPAFAELADGPEGVRLGRCAGTYLHGALEEPTVCREVLGVEVAPSLPKEQAYDRLGNWFGRHIDVPLFTELYR